MTPLSELPFLLRWLPVALVFFLYLWTIYTYVVEICIYMVPYLSEKIVYLVVFSLLLIMSVWSYLAATFTQTAKVPYQFFLTEEELQAMKLINKGKNEVLEAKGLKLRVQARTMQGGIRYCSECKCIKPDRTHHCSTCQRCILKMDHHCPWINNCVCYSNYKFFLLFLFYTTLFCFFVTTTSLQYFIKFWQSNLSVEGYGKFNILILFFLSIIFTISLFSLLLYHAYLTKVNRTTLESMRAPIFRSGADKRAYNKGAWSNVVEVFGSSHILALLPLPSPLGDGITFTPRISPIPAGYQSLENVHHHHNNHRNHSNHNNNHRLITSSVAMTPPVLTEVVAVQPDVVQDH